MTPQAIMMGLESEDPETVETTTIGTRYDAILETKRLQLGGGGPGGHSIHYDMKRDMLWRMEPLPTHPNGQPHLFYFSKKVSIGRSYLITRYEVQRL